MNNDELWVKFLNNLEGKLASVSFNCWFKDANFLDIVDNTLVFSVANDYYRTYINTYYADLLDEIIEELNIGLNGFKLLIPEEIEKNEVAVSRSICKRLADLFGC